HYPDIDRIISFAPAFSGYVHDIIDTGSIGVITDRIVDGGIVEVVGRAPGIDIAACSIEMNAFTLDDDRVVPGKRVELDHLKILRCCICAPLDVASQQPDSKYTTGIVIVNRVGIAGRASVAEAPVVKCHRLISRFNLVEKLHRRFGAWKANDVKVGM